MQAPPTRVAAPPPAPAQIPAALTSIAPYAGPALIAVVAMVMLAWTWRTWPDVIIDFGRELYLPWQIANGRTLYVDLAHFSGPLSPYWNALWFRLVGPGIMTLAFVNIALAAIFVALVYVLLRRMASRLATTAACVTFVMVFACGQFVKIGNYNWVSPYSHELPHGALLVVAALAALVRYQDSRRDAWLAAVGLATGLLVLTKVEVLVAGGVAIGAGVVLTLAAERPDARRLVRLLAILAGAAALPLVTTFAWFARVMPVSDVLTWPLGHWRAAGRSDMLSEFYKEGMGISDVGSNLGKLGKTLVWYAVALGAVTLAAIGLRRARSAQLPLAIAVFAAAAVGGYQLGGEAWVDDATRPLPLLIAALVGYGLLRFLHTWRQEPREAADAALQVAFALFGLGLLGKMFLDVKVYHYGFVLAVPGTLLLVVTTIDAFPALVARWGGDVTIARAGALGLLGAALIAHVVSMSPRIDRKAATVSIGSESFRADSRAIPIGKLLEQIRTQVGPDQTFVAFPDGVMLNYLTRRPNPTPYYLFDSTSTRLWGEDTMLTALQAHPPDFMVLVNRGYGPLRKRPIDAWIRANYAQIWNDGPTHFGDGGNPITLTLMRRNVS